MTSSEALTDSRNQITSPRRGEAVLLAFVLLSTGVVAVLEGFRLWRVGADNWHWGFHKNPGPFWVTLPALASGALLAIFVGVRLRGRDPWLRRGALAPALCLFLALLLVFSISLIGPQDMDQTILVTSDMYIGGYYAEAIRNIPNDDMGAYLREYDNRISGLKVIGPFGHIADHPVGPVLFHWLVNRAMAQSPSLAAFFTSDDLTVRDSMRLQVSYLTRYPVSLEQVAGVWASAMLYRLFLWLMLIPLYLFGRDLYSAEAALVATALAALIPSLHVFGPYPDQIFPLLAVGSLWAWYRAVRTRRLAWAALSAVFVLIGLLWSLALLAVVALIAAGTALVIWREYRNTQGRVAWHSWLTLAAMWLGVFAALSLLPKLCFGYDTWHVWKVCLEKHATFAEAVPRKYGIWVLFNPVEFAVFVGVPVFLLMTAEAVADARRLRSIRAAAPALLPWALLGVLAALNFSGKNLGEVARLWMFLMPFAAIAAGPALVRLDRGRGWPATLVLLAGLLQLVVFQWQVKVFGLMG